MNFFWKGRDNLRVHDTYKVRRGVLAAGTMTRRYANSRRRAEHNVRPETTARENNVYPIAGARRRTVAVLIAALGLVAVMAGPAVADSEQGNQTCGVNFHTWIHSESTGTTIHYAPTTNPYKTFYNGLVLQTQRSGTGIEDTSWKVSTNMYLYTPNTFAYCYI